MTHIDQSSIGFLENAQTVLVVEDETNIEALFAGATRAEIPYQFLFAKDPAQAMNILKSVIPHVLILDSALSGSHGLAFYDYLQTQEQFKHIPILLMGTEAARQVIEQRALPFIQKPFGSDELLQKLADLFPSD